MYATLVLVVVGAIIGRKISQKYNSDEFDEFTGFAVGMVGGLLLGALLIFTLVQVFYPPKWQQVETIALQESHNPAHIPYYVVLIQGDYPSYTYIDEATGDPGKVELRGNTVQVFDNDFTATLSKEIENRPDWVRTWLIGPSSIQNKPAVKYFLSVPPGGIILDSMTVGP